MTDQTYNSLSDQVTDTIRQGLYEGRWKNTLPGRHQLAKELDCSHRTAETAIQRLSKEGLLVSQGPGRQRRIQLAENQIRGTGIHLKFLLYSDMDRKKDYYVHMMYSLQKIGHRASFAKKSLDNLRMEPMRVAKFVNKDPADAWVVAGASREVLEWFIQQGIPTFAMFGRMRNIRIPGILPDKYGAISELVERLVALGHYRIVNIVSEERRKPTLGPPERFLMEQLAMHGIKTGAYNIPDWEDNPEGLQELVDSLFRHTPPTAFLIDKTTHYIAIRDQLSRMGYPAPEKVSLACYDFHPLFTWLRPSVTHIDWDSRLIVKRVVKWTNNIGRGKEDQRKTTVRAKLVLGGTIGPAR